jgi:hypothetical protein
MVTPDFSIEEASMDTMTLDRSDNAHRMLLTSALKRDEPTLRRGRPMAEDTDPDETLVEDDREALRPAQHVERKLVAMLRAAPIFVSHLQKDARPRVR